VQTLVQDPRIATPHLSGRTRQRKHC
jgi:hypothetical protein